MAATLKGWRYAAFIGGFVSFIGLALYPIIVYPVGLFVKVLTNYLVSLKFFALFFRWCTLTSTRKFKRLTEQELIRLTFSLEVSLTLLGIFKAQNLTNVLVIISDMKVWTDPFGDKKWAVRKVDSSLRYHRM